MNNKITIKYIQDLFEAAEKLPIKPSYEEFPVYVITDAIDIDKSIRWNREEIKRRMEIRDQEILRLREIKKQAIQDAHQQALLFIMQETGMSQDQAIILWDFIIANYQTRPSDLWSSLQAQIGLYNELK